MRRDMMGVVGLLVVPLVVAVLLLLVTTVSADYLERPMKWSNGFPSLEADALDLLSEIDVNWTLADDWPGLDPGAPVINIAWWGSYYYDPVVGAHPEQFVIRFWDNDPDQVPYWAWPDTVGVPCITAALPLTARVGVIATT